MRGLEETEIGVYAPLITGATMKNKAHLLVLSLRVFPAEHNSVGKKWPAVLKCSAIYRETRHVLVFASKVLSKTWR